MSKPAGKQKFITAFERGVVLQVTVGTLGVRRKVDPSKVETDADRDMIYVSKDILECDEYDAIQKSYRELKKYLEKKALPWTRRRSMYLVPSEIFLEVMEHITAVGTEWQTVLIPKFLTVYTRAQDEAKKRLGSLYDPKDYPAQADVRDAFYIDPQAISEHVPERVKTLSAVMFEQMQKRMAARMEHATEEFRLLLRQTMQELVGHLAERLNGVGETGKPKVFRNSAITHIQEFIETFDPRNVTDDHQLRALVQQTKKLLTGVDAEQLRDDEKFRASIAQNMGSVAKALDALVTEMPTRRLRFGGEAA